MTMIIKVTTDNQKEKQVNELDKKTENV